MHYEIFIILRITFDSLLTALAIHFILMNYKVLTSKFVTNEIGERPKSLEVICNKDIRISKLTFDIHIEDTDFESKHPIFWCYLKIKADYVFDFLIVHLPYQINYGGSLDYNGFHIERNSNQHNVIIHNPNQLNSIDLSIPLSFEGYFEKRLSSYYTYYTLSTTYSDIAPFLKTVKYPDLKQELLLDTYIPMIEEFEFSFGISSNRYKINLEHTFPVPTKRFNNKMVWISSAEDYGHSSINIEIKDTTIAISTEKEFFTFGIKLALMGSLLIAAFLDLCYQIIELIRYELEKNV